ncbi:unnamed protein product [Mytilus edulis]|uniref:IgGFc-binding protein N-terminal domain-containing protein n=1 Tax=Mytilus edulis TaxID=6550 RepID=A0A8S3RQE0_MYTED|nr:unnamed protein product [Mytilus edulis]
MNGSEVVDPTFVIIVDSGDIVTFESEGDLSGTFLKGNKKFAVFHSTIVTNIHHIKKGVTRPLLPTESLGTRHFMPSTLSQHGGILKIVATKGDTRVELSTMDPIILHKPGDWVTKTITNLDRIVIDSNKPIAVATVDLEMTEDIVCPKFNSILTVSPFEQWLGSSHIVIPSLSFGNVPIYIISHEEDKYSTTIDDHNSTGTATSIPGTAHVETEIIIRGKRKYYSPLSLIPGLLIDEYEDDSFYIQNPNSSFRFFAYFGNIFRLPLNHEINKLYDACTPTPMVPGDYEDNDCDGYIDEDVCITLDPSLDCAAPYTSKTGPAGTAGKHFFLAFMNDNDLYIEGNVSITLTPATALPATIHVESSFSNWKTDFTLNPGDVKQLSARKYEVIGLADLTYHATHGIIITSTSDIVVVAQYISTEIAVSSFIVYPAESIGFDYFAVTDLKGKDGKCVIVCTMNNTRVRIQLSLAANHTLSSSDFRIYRYGEVMSFQMWERQTYQITFTEDITGSRISANKPIAVFCGGNTEDKGFVAEQLLHTQTWGKHYLIPLFLDISLQTCVINISAEKEISVTVYMPLNMDVNPSNLVISSTDQYTSNSVFIVPETPFEASTTFFVGFVSRIGIESFEAVTLDGTLLPNAMYHEIGIGVHNLTTNRDMFVYIFAFSEKKTDGSNLPGYSYAYAAGMLIQQIVQDCIPSLEIVDGVDNDCDGVIDEDPCYTTLNATMGSDNSWMFEEDCNENLLSEPMTSTAEPGTSTAEPMTSTAEPGTSTAEPMTSTAEPGTSTAETMTSTARPVTSTAEPGTSTAEPMTSTAEPGTSTAGNMTSNS